MLTFMGDVALIDNSVKSEYRPTDPYIFNCEYVIGDKRELSPTCGKINLSGNSCEFKDIFGETPYAVSISNNHINDFGIHGFENTIQKLTEKGIVIIGREPLWIGNICLLAYMDLDSRNIEDQQILFNRKKVIEQINQIKTKKNAKIIVLMHWGIENDPNPSKRQEEDAHWLIDNGVDLIIGSHPHCIQKVELYKDKYIFYSLGNGLFPNINQPSHFSKDGMPSRTYRFKWQKWNRISYAVTVDGNADVVKVEKLKQTQKGVLKCIRILKPEDIAKQKSKMRFIYYIRKYLLFFVSNSFVDGKLFDFSAIKAEMSK